MTIDCKTYIYAVAPILLSCVLLFGSGEIRAEDQNAVSHGKALFMKNGCYYCHGTWGQGSISTGKPLVAPQPLPEPAFMAIVRRPYGVMPAYAPSVLSDDDLQAIYEYVKSVKIPKLKNIPLLKKGD